MRFARLGLITLALLNIATVSSACETEPDRFRLPGETVKESEERFDKTHADQWVIRKFQRESGSFERATNVYLAIVLSSVPMDLSGEKFIYPSSVVQPLLSIKGTLPAAHLKLSLKTPGSCDNIGDGDGVSAKAGAYVIVFEGLPKSNTRPNGIDSILASDALTFEILNPLYHYVVEHPAE